MSDRTAARLPVLREQLAAFTTRGALFTREGARVRCVACAHRCSIGEGHAGACGVRVVEGGELRVPHGYTARAYVRAVETNTIFHVRPGARALTFGMYGCDLRCGYCQNARVSQALRQSGEEREIDAAGESPTLTTPEALVARALGEGCQVVCAAYNEPMISVEWVRDVFLEAKRHGLVTALVSDGHSTEEALTFIRDAADVFRVDLKGITEEQYASLGGSLSPVLASIRCARRLGFWVEVVTLVVPGFNDDPGGLRAMARELSSIDRDLPWHLNGFVPRYRMRDRPPTDAATLLSAAATGYGRGLRYVYAGNVAREWPHLSHTRCPSCANEVVTRFDYATVGTDLRGGACGRCGEPIPGLLAP